MSRYYRSLIQNGILLLDVYPSALAAYSFRKLRDAYSGNCIKVRRSNDNIEQDFGFTSDGVLDTVSLLDFVGDNKFPNSEDFTNGSWGKTGITVTADATTAPDGNLTADKIIASTASTSYIFSRGSSTISLGLDYNLSVYVKASEYSRFRILSSISGSQQRVDINLNTQVVTNNLFSNNPVITDVGNGWYRCSITITSGISGSTSNGLVVYLLDNSGNVTFTGDNTSGMFFWGAQMVQASSVQSYRATTATSTILGGSGFITTWYDQSTSANHAIQISYTAQLPIVSVTTATAPIVPTNNGKPSIFNTVGGRRFSFTNTLSTPSRFSSIFVFNRPTSTGNQTSFGNASVGGRPYLFQWNGTGNILMAPGATIITTLATADTRTGNFISYTSRNTSNLLQGWVNGSALPSTGTDSTTTTITSLFSFSSAGNTSTGYFQEVVLWNVNYDANRSGIEQNINNYYGFY